MRDTAAVAMDLSAAATAWARVEAGNHFPTDVLAGAAIGNFSTRFFTELVAPNEEYGWRVSAQRLSDGTFVVEWAAPF